MPWPRVFFLRALREQIALTVAGENSCDYCASAHTAIARANGVNAQEAANNLSGESSDSRTAAILGFAKCQLCANAACN